LRAVLCGCEVTRDSERTLAEGGFSFREIERYDVPEMSWLHRRVIRRGAGPFTMGGAPQPHAPRPPIVAQRFFTTTTSPPPRPPTPPPPPPPLRPGPGPGPCRGAGPRAPPPPPPPSAPRTSPG